MHTLCNENIDCTFKKHQFELLKILIMPLSIEIKQGHIVIIVVPAKSDSDVIFCLQ